MKVHTFPQCCGAGVLILEHLTGKGKEADFALIKEWIYYAKRNGYYMYDYPNDYEGEAGNPMSSKAVLGSKTDKKKWTGRTWGMLLAITNPSQEEIATRLEEFGFKELMKVHNPVYSGEKHNIRLWGLDLNKYKKGDFQPIPETQPAATGTTTNVT